MKHVAGHKRQVDDRYLAFTAIGKQIRQPVNEIRLSVGIDDATKYRIAQHRADANAEIGNELSTSTTLLACDGFEIIRQIVCVEWKRAVRMFANGLVLLRQ